MNTVKKSIKILLWSVIGIIGSILIYFLVVLLFSRISVNSDVSNEEGGVEVFILSNGVHTDIVVPVQNEVKDWRKDIHFSQTKGNDTLARYLAFGWGDKGFYLNTPTWADLKFSTAFQAASGFSTSAMHCTFYRKMKKGPLCQSVVVSKENYKKLVSFIENSFQTQDGAFIKIETNAVYGKDDVFFEAKGSYNLFYTCNTWTNSALKEAQQKAALWTVYDKGILRHYE